METNWQTPDADREVIPAFVYAGLRNSMRHYRSKIVDERESEMPYIAWLARNILELRIWVEYCAMSQANALEFYDDALRDLVDMNCNKMDELDEDLKAVLRAAVDELPKTKASHKFKHVDVAAEECGLKELYQDNYKPLSKLAHPTAIYVLARPGAGSAVLRRQLVQKAFQLAEDGLQRLEWSILGDAYRKHRAELERQNAMLPWERRLFLASD